MADICFHARFEDSAGDGVDGLAVTWNVNRITRSTAAYFAEVTGGATTTAVGRDGLYVYLLTGANLVLYDYTATAITASATPTVHEVAAVWTLWALSWHDIATSAMTLVGSIGKWIVDLVDSIWDEPMAAHLAAGSVGEQLDSLCCTLGTGSVAYPYTVYQDVADTIPLPGVLVQVSTDIAGVNIVATGTTNAFGVITFYLDPGTYYFWNSLAGWSFSPQPDTEVVT